MPAKQGARTTLALGMLGRPHGLAGEVVFRPYDPASASIASVRTVLLVGPNGRREPRALKSVRPVAGGFLISLEGIDSRADAARLGLAEVHVDRGGLGPLLPGEFYVQDLPGCSVSSGGRVLGVVDHTFWNGAHDVMVVAGATERLIPVVPAYVRAFDPVARRITVAWDELDDG